MNHLRERKAEARATAAQRRDAVVDRKQRSQQIRSQLRTLSDVASADSYFCFVSFRSEVDTRPWIERWLREKKVVSVPWCRGNEMHAVRIDSLDQLEPNAFGVLEPPASLRKQSDRIDPPVDVAIVPGLAFTKEGHRLGYGRGYYDRWLTRHPGVARIAVAFEAQIIDELPFDQHDAKIHRIVTESRIIDAWPVDRTSGR